MMLSLMLPVEQEVFYENQLFPRHPHTMYYIDSSDMVKTFNKTPRHSPPRIKALVPLEREINFTEYLKRKNVDSKYLSLPDWVISSDGVPIIIQEYREDGDLLSYLINNPSLDIDIATAKVFLNCIRNILPILQDNNVSYGDFCPENFMVDNKLENLILIDYGQGIIFNDSMKHEWDPDDYLKVRPYLLPPDMFTIHGNKCFMEIKEIQELLLKKDMFVIGAILYMILFRQELWDSDLNTSPENKIKDLIKFRSEWNNSMNDVKRTPNEYMVFKILLGLLPVKLDDIITLHELYDLIDELDNSGKKRKRYE